MAGALSHIRVLDLSRILAGPWASQNPGDLGAEVSKIEHSDGGGGDDTRNRGSSCMPDVQVACLDNRLMNDITSRNSP